MWSWLWAANSTMVTFYIKESKYICSQRPSWLHAYTLFFRWSIDFPKMIALMFLLCSSRYHIPRSWLKPTKNILVLFEELGGDASRISLLRRSMTGVCGEAIERHVKNESYIIESNGEPDSLHLQCNPGQVISAVKFASFGTPSGTCGSYQKGTCHAPDSHAILEKVL